MEETVPIQTLAPDAELPSNAAIRAVVTLAWPFSSSTRQCALLLADPDFRLRTRKGQVRVRFTGPSAEAVAKSRIGIGDEITLRLGGATWAEPKEGAIRTPGKSVDGELVFARQLGLKVARDSGEADISLDAPPSPQKPTHEYTEAANSTPLPKAVRDLRSSWHESGVPIYSSPAFAKRLRLSGDSFSSSAFDPFVDEQAESDERANKKLWTSFGSVSQWRYAGRSPSPPKDTPGFDLQAELDRQDAEDRAQFQDAVIAQSGRDEGAPSHAIGRDTMDLEAETSPQGHTSPIPAAGPPKPLPNDGLTIADMPNLQDQTSQLFTEMPPPPLPRSRTNELTQADDLARSQSPTTPELRAVPNSGLPLPSPFPAEGSQAHYFEQHQESDVPKVSSQLGEERTDGAVVEQQVPTTNLSPVSVSDTGGMEKGVIEPKPSSNGIAQMESQQGAGENESQRLLSSAAKSKTQRDKVLRSELDPPVPPSPRPTVATPVKLPPNIFSLDGAGTTASNFSTPVKEPKPTPGSTPQSQRDKVMRQTFKSLFGIQTSPEPEMAAQSPVPQQQPTEDAESRFGGTKDADGLFISTLGQDTPERASISTQAARERREDPQTQNPERDTTFGSLPVPQVETQGEAKRSQDAEILAEKERQQSIPEQQGDDTLQDQASSIFAQKREDLDIIIHPAETPSNTSVVGQTIPASQPDQRSSTATETVMSQQEPPPSSAPAVIHLDSSSDVDPEDTVDQDETRRDSAPKAESPDTSAAQQVDEGGKRAALSGSQPIDRSSGRFPRDRVIEDSQDELPTLLKTQASPAMDKDKPVPNEKKTQAPVLEEDEVEEPQDLAEEENDALEYQAERQVQSASVVSDEEMEDADADSEDADLREENVAELEDEPMHDGPLSISEEQIHPLTTGQPAAEGVDLQGGSENGDALVNEVRRDGDVQPSQGDTQLGVIELDSSSPAPQIEPVASTFGTASRPSEDLQELAPKEVELDLGTGLQSSEQISLPLAPDERIMEASGEESIADSHAPLKEASRLPSESLEEAELKAFESETASLQPQSHFTTQETSQQPETQIPLTDLSESVKDQRSGVDASVTDLRPSSTPETSQQSEVQTSVTQAQGGIEEPVVLQELIETSEVALPKAQDADDMDKSVLPTPQQTQAKTREMSEAGQAELYGRDGIDADQTQAAVIPGETAMREPNDTAGLGTRAPSVTAGEESATPASTALRQAEQDVVQTPHPQVITQTPIQSAKRKSTPRKSLSARLSHVPDVISAWFSPRRSSVRTDAVDSPSTAQQSGEFLPLSTEKATDQPVVDAAQTSTDGKIPQLMHTESNGILTSMGYYTPLSRLEEYLNPASQAVYGTNTIDIIAVVSDSTRKPERAKGGPKDYFTIFRTTEPSTNPTSSVRVEVFRPWKAKLPVAEVGDVILLRGFVVKSRKRKPYLLSTDASGWCVWRYAEYLRSQSHPDSLSSVREVVTGPPVELSEAERSQVRTLREWWVATHPVEEGQGEEQGFDGLADSQAEQQGAAGITARL
ncbi:hypothetical protein KC343_g1435 [Hortaea werneckii]|nr:hypothetical protein KC323_g8550 [Hortaea werneckii]KAI7345951.1 hypothetical protein KC320_g8106 [Hortaea werneckii]KAI7571448.1 hypothetical protein KC317_g1623 [Hortaea werneckii]KAI7626219.1 hypothetical protein KC346_g1369 [Hortaea werneckii]KAI7636122.1 hypothetical protein KC343_g1435 [Hortaea werneckii]